MDQIYQWCQHNSAIVAVIVGVAGLFIGAKKNAILNAVRGAGFAVGQFLVHTLGKKAEDAAKQVVDAFEQGLDSDEKITAVPPVKTDTTAQKQLPAADTGVTSNNDIVG